MPLNLNLKRLDEGDGVEVAFRIHGAQWQKKCQQSRAKATTVQQSNPSVHMVSLQMFKVHEPVSLFCNEPVGSVGLHEAATKQIDKKIRKHVHDLKQTNLLAKLAAGDMIAIEAKYHKNCLSIFYNTAKQTTSQDLAGDKDHRLYGTAFAELVAFIEEASSDEDKAPVFKLADLAQL